MPLQGPELVPKHAHPGILLIGCAAPGLLLLVESAGRCFSLQTVCDVPCQCRFGACSVVKQYHDPFNGMHSFIINIIGCSGENIEYLGQIR